MSYFHMFYAVDLDRLRALYGSNDESFIREVLQACARDLEENDEFFEDYDDEPLPSSETLLREIIAGEIQTHEQGGVDAKFGYVLKILCEHIGDGIDENVACVSDHPYESQLTRSGPPLPIPVDEGDFPEIGFLACSDIAAEIQRIEEALETFAANAASEGDDEGDDDPPDESLPPSFIARVLRFFGFHQLARGNSSRFYDDDLAEDLTAYQSTLQQALDMRRSLVSFRH